MEDCCINGGRSQVEEKASTSIQGTQIKQQLPPIYTDWVSMLYTTTDESLMRARILRIQRTDNMQRRVTGLWQRLTGVRHNLQLNGFEA